MEMLTLFGDTGVAVDGGNDYGIPCLRPNASASTAYRYGCRCPRCIRGKSRDRARAMAGLAPICAVEGCDNPKRRMSGAKYCEEHATSINYRSTGKHHREKFSCIGCGGTYQSNYANGHQTTYKVCSPCRTKSVAMLNRARAHGVPSETVAEWMRDRRCNLCRRELYLGKGKQGAQGFAVDHDHDHCPGQTGCRECVRGLLCSRCNVRVGAYEALHRDVGMARVAQYLQGAGF